MFKKSAKKVFFRKKIKLFLKFFWCFLSPYFAYFKNKKVTATLGICKTTCQIFYRFKELGV